MKPISNKLLTTLAFLLITSNSFAGESQGYVTEVRASASSDTVLFRLTGEIVDTPRCNEEKYFVISMRSVGGAGLLSTISLAVQNRLPVAVTGLNTCSWYWKAEDVKEITIYPPVR